MDIAIPLVRTILNIGFKDLPSPVVEVVKQHILHTLAALVGGSNAPGCNMVVDLMEEWGGCEESTIFVYGIRVPSVHAAFANSTMAHALDYCVNDDRTHYKSSVVTVPAAFNIAEKKVGVSGKDLLTAVCMGIELGIRIALATNPKPSHALSPILGCFASTAAAGKILGLDEEEMLDALGIAYCQATASGLSIVSPALTKRLGPGLAARAGIFSSLLAKKGFKSSRYIFQSPNGYFRTFHGVEGDLDTLTADFGKKFEIISVGPKGYPCCRVLHGPIDATLSLVQDHDIKPGQVEEVIVHESNKCFPVELDPEILERKRHPRGDVDAQFSVPWAVAVSIVRREVFIEDFTEERIKDLEIQRMAERVRSVADSSLDREDRVLTPVIVEIKTKDGKVYTKRVDFPKGNPNNPVTLEETKENFRRCANYAVKPLKKEKVEEAIEMICNLEEVDEVKNLIPLLIP